MSQSAPPPDVAHKSGFVTLVGQPNVGKSTLLNRLLGQKLAITSNRPQTTRNRIPGVLTRESAQVVLVDTPGLHAARRALNSFMVDVAHDALWETDAVALLVEAGIGRSGQVGVADIVRELLDKLRPSGKPVVLVLNKIDRVETPQLLPIIDAWKDAFPFAAIVPVSALRGHNLDGLLDALVAVLPEGPPLYPEDALTDLPERFVAAEMIREKAFRLLGEEVPYAIAVTIEEWQDRSMAGRIHISALIHVERDSQKSIVIGRGGRMIKEIGTRARQDLERMLGTRVDLRLFVRVEKGWTRSVKGMRKLGYEAQRGEAGGER